MTMDRRQALTALGISASALALPGRALAQAFKGNGRIFAGFPAGGTLDATARRLAESIRANYPDGLIVENRVGAGGRLAVDALKSASPDGLAMLVSPDSMFTIYPSYYKKLSYNVDTDIAPVSPMVTLPYGFAVSSKVPAAVKTLPQFVDWAKKNAKDAAYGHPSTGSSPHFAGAEFNRVAGAGMRHVPYRGSAPAVQDLLGGHVASVMLPLGDVMQFAGGDNTRLIGVTSPKRSRFVPNVATFAEQGFDQVTSVETYGVYLPGKASAGLRQRFADMVKKAAADPAVIKSMDALGMELTPMAPAEFVAYLVKQRAKWTPIVKASGFSAEE
jgi:tripartite-type tricarboxylate transporter receptor subunit TctC